MYKAYTLFAGLFVATCLASATANPANAQGMRSVPSVASTQFDLGKLEGVDERHVATLQRLLRRLGYLKDDQVTRKVDPTTLDALGRFLASAGPNADTSTFDKMLHLMFRAVWEHEGWGKSDFAAREVVVEPEKIKSAQETLKQIGYEPGPADGKFGPATLSAVETFQEDKGMKVDGLLTRNTYDNVMRSMNLAGEKPAGTVRMLNWPDYIDPAILDQFEKDTKIEVVHEVFENSDETKELLLGGSNKYDLIVQPGYQIRPVLEQGALKELDKSKLPNIANLDPAALRYTDMLDPGNAHSVPYMWGTVGIGVNESAVKRLVPDAKLNSLSLFLDPKIAQALSSCGLAVVDEPTDVMPALVAYIGGDISKIGIADLEAVDKTLSKVSPYLTIITDDRFIDGLAEGKYCAAIGYSGDVFQARDKAKKDGRSKISYFVPQEGSQLWFDLLVIPKNAPHIDEAYQLLNYLMKPEVAAANTNYLQYANPNSASAPFIDAALMNDPGLYPPADVLAKLAVLQPLTNKVDSELQRIWSKLPHSQ